MTYEKVNALEPDPAFQIPFVAIQEGPLEGALFHTTIEGDGLEGHLG